MKLRNKKTGEILETARSSTVLKDKFRIYDELTDKYYTYCSLAELNEEWEDVPEEPKEYWCIDWTEPGIYKTAYEDERDDFNIEIGNYFDTREEAEKAVEKLKAIQRLKSHYIKFKLDFVKNKIDFTYRIDGTLHSSVNEERIIFEDLDLLFGGEE